MSQNQPEEEKRIRARWLVGLALLALVVAVLTTIVVRGLRDPLRAPPLAVADVSSERLLALGNIVGLAAAHDTHAWLGVPYAQPPVGELRWRSPQPAPAWVDTFDALTLAPPCFQVGTALGGVPAEDDDGFAGSEDCLYLNVWAPRREPDALPSGDARWPVMVWIHGGGNRYGYAGSSMTDGARLAGSQEVVVVSVGYRLGPFGWLSHPALRAAATDPLEASGNFGLLDQILALEWVQAHIEDFGGNPDNVTIFGESAGARDVLALLVAGPARGLFHRAIAQSGSTATVSRWEAEAGPQDTPPGHPNGSSEIVASLFEAAGVVPDRAAARSYAEALPLEDLADYLRSRSASEILGAYQSDPSRDQGSDDDGEVPRRTRRPRTPVVPNLIRDGVLLPEEGLLARLRSGRFHRVPVLLGWNRDEWKLWLSQDPRHVRKRFGLVYRIRDPEDYVRRARAHSELWAVRAVGEPAAAMAAAGWSRVHAYRFDWDDLPRVLGQEMSILLGAAHGFELPFLFGSFDLGDPLLSRLLYVDETEPERRQLSESMMAYWAEFARSGQPGRGGRADLPPWPSWRASATRPPADPAAQTGRVLVLDAEAEGGIRPEAVRLDRASVIAGIAAEPELSPGARCGLLDEVFAAHGGVPAGDWRRLGCAELRSARDSPPRSLR